jgi:hypothetical protein
VRINFNYFFSEAVVDYIIASMLFIAREGHHFLTDYSFDPNSGIWHHRNGPVEPALRLREISYSEAGQMIYPTHEERAPESALADYLKIAGQLAADRKARIPLDLHTTITALSERFESLRWFELPNECLLKH